MKVLIENVKNIKEANIELENNKINFIYGENGVGKSSLLTALYLNQEDLNKYKSFYDWGEPRVFKPKDYKYELFSNKTFTIDYVKDKNNNIYELIFKDEYIEKLEIEIKKDLKVFENILETEEIVNLETKLKEFLKIFNITKVGNVKKTRKVKSIEKYKPFNKKDLSIDYYNLYTKTDQKVKWINWLKEGENYKYESKCPYCTQDITRNIKTEITNIIEFSDPKALEDVEEVSHLISQIDKHIYINNDFFQRIFRGRSNINANTNQKILMKEINKIQKVLKFIEESKELIKNDHHKKIEKIQKDFLKYMKEPKLKESIYQNIKQYNLNVRKISGTKTKITKTINKRIVKYNDIINKFLKTSGINYKIVFSEIEDNPIKLTYSFNHKKIRKNIESNQIDNHLSFGEEKIITALLFLLYKSSDEKTVFLFDDPITLFDKNKRFAFLNIISTLKKQKISKNKKIIKSSDYIIILSHSFDALKEALTIKETNCYIANNVEGMFELEKITKRDLNSYYENIIHMIKSTNVLLVKLVLLRSLIETKYINKESQKIYNFISSVIKWQKPQTKGGEREYTNDEIEKIIKSINDLKIFKLDKKTLMDELRLETMIRLYNLSVKWYEKIILFRIINDIVKNKDDDKIMRRFITTLFHVENDLLFSLSSDIYPTVPKYVIDLIDDKMLKIKNNINFEEYIMPNLLI